MKAEKDMIDDEIQRIIDGTAVPYDDDGTMMDVSRTGHGIAQDGHDDGQMEMVLPDEMDGNAAGTAMDVSAPPRSMKRQADSPTGAPMKTRI